MERRKIILFELNEVPFRIIDEFCRRHPQSCLARHLSGFRQFTTVTRDSVLSPWITWPTLHRGVTDSQHGLHHLGQNVAAVDEKFPPVWHRLVSQGIRVGIFGSLHTYPLPQKLERYAFYLPDTFAPAGDAHPAQLRRFQEFNLTMVSSSPRNVRASLPMTQSLRLTSSAARLGITVRTLADITRQLADEAVRPWRRIRRRTYQAVLAFDIFLRQLRRRLPDFSTFFTNQVASSMHRYWIASFPEDYQAVGFSDDWMQRYRDEIDFAMRKFDAFLDALLQFVRCRPEFSLWIASSMGQAAMHGTPLKTQLIVADLPKFMNALGVNTADWSRRTAMAPDISVHVREGKAATLLTALEGLRIDHNPVTWDQREDGFFSISLGHRNLSESVDYADLDGQRVSFQQLGMLNLKIEDESNSSAYHVPEGVLLIFDPRDRRQSQTRRRVETTEIAPGILRTFGLMPPKYMQEPTFLHS